jgi:hypothetical protein
MNPKSHIYFSLFLFLLLRSVAGRFQTSEVKSEFLGAVSGYLQKVPESKSKALWKEMLTTPTGLRLLLVACAKVL